MRVTLAAPYGSHKAGASIEVPDHEGKDLVRVGRARPADDKPADDKKKEA